MKTELKAIMQEKMSQYKGVVFKGVNGREVYGEKGQFTLKLDGNEKIQTDDIDFAIMWLSGKLHLA